MLRDADLGGADLSGLNLSHSDLSGALLDEANLSGADLSHTWLDSASLAGANLKGAKLFRASLRNADLSAADLSNTELVNASLRGANLSETNLKGADFSGTRISFLDRLEPNVISAWLRWKLNRQDTGPGAQTLVSVKTPDGSSVSYDDWNRLRNDIIAGKHRKDAECTMPDTGKEQTKLMPLRTFAARKLKLEALYKPVTAHILRGLICGAIAGIVIDAGTWLWLNHPDRRLAFAVLLFVFVVGGGTQILPRKWRGGAWALAFVAMFQAGLHKPYNPGVAPWIALGIVTGGALFGGLGGMIIGTAVGLFRRNSIPKAPDAEPEGKSVYFWGLVFPVVMLVLLITVYEFYILPWAMQNLETMGRR